MTSNSWCSHVIPVMRSFKWSGLKPSGPADDPLGNDWIAALTASGKTLSGIASLVGVGRRSAGFRGWRWLSWLNVNVSGVTNLSSEHSSRTAPLTSPSSNLAEANKATIWYGDLRGFNQWVEESIGTAFWDVDEGLSSISYSRICLKMLVVKLCDLPPRFSLARHAVGKHSKLVQLASVDGLDNTFWMGFISKLDTAGLAPLGILLGIGLSCIGCRMPPCCMIGSVAVWWSSELAVYLTSDGEHAIVFDCSGCLDSWGCTESGTGSLSEPVQGLFLGPCLWIVPSFTCICRVAKQTLHIPLLLLASWDSAHVWECGIEWLVTTLSAPVDPSFNSTLFSVSDILVLRTLVRHMEIVRSMVIMFMFYFSRTAHTLHDELTSVVKAIRRWQWRW